MATSEVELANIALRRAGQQTIASFDDESENARVVSDLYDNCRDFVLGVHPWNCATKRVQLAVSATAPTFEYTYAYPVPTDYLRLVKAEYPDQMWRLELITEEGIDRKAFVTDESPFKIVYIAQIENVVLMPPSLQDAIAWRLSAEVASRLTGSDNKAAMHWQMYERALVEARYQDSTTAPPLDTLEPYTFLSARWGRGGQDNSYSRGW